MSGIYAIYKPQGPTSHDVIYKLHKITGVKKIGHAGKYGIKGDFVELVKN